MQTFDVRSVIARIVDGSKFDEFKALYGNTLVCGFARLYGYPVGIIANNGILFSESSLKGAHFIEVRYTVAVIPNTQNPITSTHLCSCVTNAASPSSSFKTLPDLWSENDTKTAASQRMALNWYVEMRKHPPPLCSSASTTTLLALQVMAVSCAQVPKLTMIIGGSFGAGNYGMCGRAFSPRFLYMWPNAKISVMGGEQAASVLATIQRDNKEAAGHTWSKEEEEAFKTPIRAQYEHQGSAYFSSANLWDDGIIEPQNSRHVLGLSLAACYAGSGDEGRSSFGVFRM